MKTLRLAGVSAVLMSALLLAGCGSSPDGDKVASLGGGDKDKASQNQDADVPKDPHEKMLKFAKCMRENGIDMPDPGASGGNAITLGGDGDSKKMEDALKACGKSGGVIGGRATGPGGGE